VKEGGDADYVLCPRRIEAEGVDPCRGERDRHAPQAVLEVAPEEARREVVGHASNRVGAEASEWKGVAFGEGHDLGERALRVHGGEP